MDRSSFEMDSTAIYAHSNGYAYARVDGACVTHHSTILTDVPAGFSVDHLNWQKMDNRRANLRIATASEQISNRTERADKKPPPPELTELGIHRLPRCMRWDVGEGKFVVDPMGAMGTQISGTKSTKVSIVNRFRDCLEKMIAASQEDDEVTRTRVQLAHEYNELVRAAHVIFPEIFPDGPYADLESMCGELAYCQACMKKLPPPTKTDSIAIVKATQNENKFILFDSAFVDAVANLPTCDVSGTSPIMVATRALRERYPGIVSEADVAAKKKILLKDIVWSSFLGHPRKPDDATIVPLNYQQYDLRAENLLLLPGTSKEHKSPEGIPVIPEGLGISMRFWPRGVSLATAAGTTQSKKSPWVLFVRVRGAKRSSFSCSATTVDTVLQEKVFPLLRMAADDFDTVNATYQRLLAEYQSVTS
ncbi:hypothetical protein TSOC_012839 [Tetrabaena socialis]|uniref:Uncharacterized protein n=1 Tax=Tetrabaena socialis TaxID=47790 RepID=A0A2J7ZLZ3_9CHLO|nr:hypothetical protein TSOC_012839 [Tetrabaena socialis]|eukprot:PNH01289.1 hypothetical protein TSOC_012839 [Tetrabaena socialis]